MRVKIALCVSIIQLSSSSLSSSLSSSSTTVADFVADAERAADVVAFVADVDAFAADVVMADVVFLSLNLLSRMSEPSFVSEKYYFFVFKEKSKQRKEALARFTGVSLVKNVDLLLQSSLQVTRCTAHKEMRIVEVDNVHLLEEARVDQLGFGE